MPDLPTRISSEPTPLKPLLLPKFLFLLRVRDPETQRSITDAICSNTLNTIPESFDAPLYEAANALLLGGIPPATNLEKTSVGETIPDFVLILRDWLRERFDNDVLGQMALDNTKGEEDLWDNFLFIDVMQEADIVPFLQEYGVDQCLILAPAYCELEDDLFEEAARQDIPLRIVSGFTNGDDLLSLLQCLPRPSQPWKNDHRHEGEGSAA